MVRYIIPKAGAPRIGQRIKVYVNFCIITDISSRKPEDQQTVIYSSYFTT